MRELFLSEQRYIRNVLWKGAKGRVDTSDPVVLEHYSLPRQQSRARFNSDYFLQFVPDKMLFDFTTKTYSAPVLTNTMGVDVFLTVDERTLRVLRTELLGGDGFPIRFFKEHVTTVERTLAKLSCPVNLRRTGYCRIFVIENDICFLAFPKDPVPVVRGQKQLLRTDEDSAIICSVDGADIVYVDGWIRTFVQDSVRKLEAIAQ